MIRVGVIGATGYAGAELVRILSGHPDVIQRGKKVIDLSADFRFKDVLRYEAYYQPHTAKELLKEAVYGLCEIYFDKIKNASLIGNPGCYPTSVLLPLVPLLKENFLDINTIIADSKSGVSGAGRSLSLTTHFCEANESSKAYKVAEHRHCPEMEEILLFIQAILLSVYAMTIRCLIHCMSGELIIAT
jgi:N-acetyl-gamma-glutamyl-phosphate reductase